MTNSADNLIGLVLESKEEGDTPYHPGHETKHYRGSYRFARGGRLTFEYIHIRPQSTGTEQKMPDPFRSASQEKETKEKPEAVNNPRAAKRPTPAKKPSAASKPKPSKVETKKPLKTPTQRKVEKKVEKKPETPSSPPTAPSRSRRALPNTQPEATKTESPEAAKPTKEASTPEAAKQTEKAKKPSKKVVKKSKLKKVETKRRKVKVEGGVDKEKPFKSATKNKKEVKTASDKPKKPSKVQKKSQKQAEDKPEKPKKFTLTQMADRQGGVGIRGQSTQRTDPKDPFFGQRTNTAARGRFRTSATRTWKPGQEPPRERDVPDPNAWTREKAEKRADAMGYKGERREKYIQDLLK